MADRATFERYVQEALDHLYDPAALLVHPLATLIHPDPRAEPPGHALHRSLRDALNALKPPPGAPPHSPALRLYRYLSLRYVEMLTIGQVADELGISPRQCRRDHHDAIRAISAILWDVYQRRLTVASERGRDDGSSILGSTPLGGASPDDSSPPTLSEAEAVGTERFEREVGRLGATVEPPVARLDQVIEGVIATVGALAARKQCRLVLCPASAIPPVRADRTALRQILVELFLFAIDHASEGAVRVEIRADREMARLVLIAGRETHHALVSDDDPRLAVSRRLATLLDLTLALETGGDDLVVRLDLPTAGRAEILVVDDNADVVHLFRHFLGDEYQVIEAANGVAALETARQRRPALITLDVMMPAQDGWEVLQTLKQDPTTVTIPVVVCSVLRERELALSLGAADFLVKPILAPDLRGCVRRCLRSARRETTSGTT